MTPDPLQLPETAGADPSHFREIRAILDALYGIAVVFLFVLLLGCLAGTFAFGYLTIASLAPGVR